MRLYLVDTRGENARLGDSTAITVAAKPGQTLAIYDRYGDKGRLGDSTGNTPALD